MPKRSFPSTPVPQPRKAFSASPRFIPSSLVLAVAGVNRKKGVNQPLYAYMFDAEIPGWDNPGTFHSVDLWFFFETLAKCWRPFKGKHYDLARSMCDYWANFIKTGNPNGKDLHGDELPEWKPFSDTDLDRMVFKDAPCPEKHVLSEQEKFLYERFIEKI